MHKANTSYALARVEERVVCCSVVQAQSADIYRRPENKTRWAGRDGRQASTVFCCVSHSDGIGMDECKTTLMSLLGESCQPAAIIAATKLAINFRHAAATLRPCADYRFSSRASALGLEGGCLGCFFRRFDVHFCALVPYNCWVDLDVGNDGSQYAICGTDRGHCLWKSKASTGLYCSSASFRLAFSPRSRDSLPWVVL